MRRYLLRRVELCDAAQQREVLSIRNAPSVRSRMYTDHEITADEHRNYVAGLATSERERLYAVLRDGRQVAGTLGFKNIDRVNKRTDWAFYLREEERGGLGSALEAFVLDEVLVASGFAKLNCEVLENNPAVVALHERFGFAREGFRTSEIERSGTRLGVYCLGITRGDWMAARGGILRRISDRLSAVAIVPDGGRLLGTSWGSDPSARISA